MFEVRQVLTRMRLGDTDRAIARAGLMGRRKLAQLRRTAEAAGWLDVATALPGIRSLPCTWVRCAPSPPAPIRRSVSIPTAAESQSHTNRALQLHDPRQPFASWAYALGNRLLSRHPVATTARYTLVPRNSDRESTAFIADRMPQYILCALQCSWHDSVISRFLSWNRPVIWPDCSGDGLAGMTEQSGQPCGGDGGVSYRAIAIGSKLFTGTVATRNLRNRYPRYQRLRHNAALLLVRPPPTHPSPSRHRKTPSCPLLIGSGHLPTLTNLQAWDGRQPPRKGGMGRRTRCGHAENADGNAARNHLLFGTSAEHRGAVRRSWEEATPPKAPSWRGQPGNGTEGKPGQCPGATTGPGARADSVSRKGPAARCDAGYQGGCVRGTSK